MTALFLLLTALQGAPMLDPAMGVVLAGERGQELLLGPTCSRQLPGPVQGWWSPDAATMARLETALGPALQSALGRLEPRLLPPGSVTAADYIRQYVGAEIRGERIVYINGFLSRMVTAAQRDIELNHTTLAAYWRTHRVGGLCDGGAHLFGAEFIPATGEIRNLRFDQAAPSLPWWISSKP